MRFAFLFVFSISLFGSISSFAQENPGYMGKKNILFGNVRTSFMPMLYSVVGSEETATGDIFNWGLGAYRVLSKKTALGASYSFYDDELRLESDISTGSGMNVKGQEFSFFINNYYYNNHGSIAPLGKRFKYGFLFSTSNITNDSDTKIGDVQTLGLSLGSGKSRVFFDRIWVDYGWDFAYLLKIREVQYVSGGFDYTDLGHERQLFNYMVNFNVAFGLLL